MGLLQPLRSPLTIRNWANQGVTSISLDLMPSALIHGELLAAAGDFFDSAPSADVYVMAARGMPALSGVAATSSAAGERSRSPASTK